MTSLALVPDSGLVVHTLPITFEPNLLALLPEGNSVAWVQGQIGKQTGAIGWGEIERQVFHGPERFSRAQKWWHTWCEQHSGSQALAFTSFAFSSNPGESVLIIPEVIVRNVGDKTLLTVITEQENLDQKIYEASAELERNRNRHSSLPEISWQEGSRSVSDWQLSVEGAVTRIQNGELDKVVLARDIFADALESIDLGVLMMRLNQLFPDCWTFNVAGLVGATPELLLKRDGTSITSRVLAGTVKRSSNVDHDDALAAALLDSSKDQEEHEYAVASVRAALAPHCTDLTIPGAPTVLQLANVQHLATDITGQLAENVSALTLAASLHPTAAVCGTPTERALALILELEGMDRGRYAGPIGWISSDGNGELGIALRCANVENADRTRLRLFAGCGIVSESTGEMEVAESNAKFNAMRAALQNES